MADNGKLPYFFLGLGLGVIVGMLFAPHSGEKTRTMIRSKADEGKDYLRRRTGELKESASSIIDRGREVLDRQREHLSAAVEAGKQAYRDTVGEAAPAAPPPAPAANS